MAKLCDQGENDLLNIYLKNATQNANLYLGLYTSPNYEPGEAAILSDLVEPSGGNYARIQLTPAGWTLVGAVAEQAVKTFSATGAAWGNVYGYFITNVASGTSGKLIAVENFSDGPYNVPDGDTVKIAPKLTAS
jgi:hypothetical protein